MAYDDSDAAARPADISYFDTRARSPVRAAAMMRRAPDYRHGFATFAMPACLKEARSRFTISLTVSHSPSNLSYSIISDIFGFSAFDIILALLAIDDDDGLTLITYGDIGARFILAFHDTSFHSLSRHVSGAQRTYFFSFIDIAASLIFARLMVDRYRADDGFFIVTRAASEHGRQPLFGLDFKAAERRRYRRPPSAAQAECIPHKVHTPSSSLSYITLR